MTIRAVLPKKAKVPLKRYKFIFIYIVLAYTIPLICLGAFHLISVLQSGIGYFILFGLSAISPTLAALLTALFQGKGSLAALLKCCFNTRFKKRLCIFAIVVPVIEIAIMQILSRINSGQFVSLRSISLMQFFIVGYSLIAEEMGWRGFLQKRLDDFGHSYLTPLFTGVIWAFWHYHFYLIGSMSYPVYWFFIGCLADSYIYYWITKKANGNIVPACILHFFYNLVSTLFFVSDTSHPRIYAFFVMASVVVAACIIFWSNISRKRKNQKRIIF